MLLPERVRLDLVHRGHDVVLGGQVHEAVDREIADSDGPGPTAGENFLHGPPLGVVAVGLVDQMEVDVLQAEPGQGSFEGPQGVVLDAGVLDPQFGGDEQFAPVDAGCGDGSADGFSFW